MRRHLCSVVSSEKESISKKRSVQSMLSQSNDTEITKRDAHQTDDDAFSRIEYIDLHVLSPQGNEREKEDRENEKK